MPPCVCAIVVFREIIIRVWHNDDVADMYRVISFFFITIHEDFEFEIDFWSLLYLYGIV